jgi:hypothetical protein
MKILRQIKDATAHVFPRLRAVSSQAAAPDRSEDPLVELAACMFLEAGMPELQVDKLVEEYTLRIPEVTKRRLDRLTKPQRKQMNELLLVSMAKFLHEANFDPSRYLAEEYDTRNGESR